jgi:hypothetical protein
MWSVPYFPLFPGDVAALVVAVPAAQERLELYGLDIAAEAIDQAVELEDAGMLAACRTGSCANCWLSYAIKNKYFL